jgi:DNA-binding transcriptional LysR family regulator
MNWDDARLFLAVVRAGQMLGAAQRLGLNQATLSRRIAALEAELGTALLVRRTRGCTPTEAGAALAERLDRVEAEMLAAQAGLGRADAAVTGTVRIGAPDGFGVAFLAPRLGRLAERHPELRIQLVPVPRTFSLSEREADIAVMVGRPEQGRLVVRKLTDYTLGLYAARGYLDRAGTPADLAALARDHRLVGYVEDLIYAPGLDYAGEILRGWRSTLEVSSATGQVEAVRGGAGIGVLHDHLARPFPELVPVLPATRVTRAYWIAWHESLRDLARVQTVARFLVEAVRESRGAFTPGTPAEFGTRSSVNPGA